MIGMFVRDNDAVEPIDVSTYRGQAPQRFFFAEPRVHQKPGRARLEQRAIARAA